VSKSTCQICGREYNYKRGAGHTKAKCNSCMVNLRRFMIKERCLKFKGGKCENCSYDKSKRALSFHHIDPKEKDFNIANAHCKTWELIKVELDKCKLLCSNCHMEEHERLDYRDDSKKEWAPQVRALEEKAYGTMPRREQKIAWPTSEELTKLVWELPATKIAETLGVSSKSIEKHCKKLGISRPGRGYWRKLETNKL